MWISPVDLRNFIGQFLLKLNNKKIHKSVIIKDNVILIQYLNLEMFKVLIH